jgi:transcriptional regulator with XRE-family HTH domain
MSGELLKSVRKKQGVTLEQLSEETGISMSTLSRLESNGRKLKVEHIQLIAPALGVQPSDLLPPDMVPIVGLAGAGPEGTVQFATGDGNFGEAPAPVDASPGTRALEVRGESMRGTANDGWLIFYDDRAAPDEEHMGELCVCWLEDDRVLVKTPYPGRGSGLFDLESTNAPTMRDVPVRYFALVTDIKTRKSAKKYIRQHPETDIPDVKIAS